MSDTRSYNFTSLEDAVRAAFDEINLTNAACVEMRGQLDAQRRVIGMLSHYLAINGTIDRDTFNAQIAGLSGVYSEHAAQAEGEVTRKQFEHSAQTMLDMLIPDGQSPERSFTVIDGGKE